jgi:polyphosphate kinase 2 (PPK2 family)
MKKSAYKERMEALELQLGALQRQVREQNLPVVIVFEGRDAAGKGTMINRLVLALDARGFKVHAMNAPTEEERFRPFLWRFWVRLPVRGSFAIFDRSWYGRVQVERVDRLVKKPVWRRAYDEINEFERQLLEDGTVLIKFFLEIGPQEQKRRLETLRAHPVTAWKVDSDVWRRHRQFNRYSEALDEMLEKTSTERAPWTVVDAEKKRGATLHVFETVIAALEQRVRKTVKPAVPVLVARGESRLAGIDLSATLERTVYEQKLEVLQRKLFDLEHEMYQHRLPAVIVFEGADAAGKGGVIRRLAQALDPRGYEVLPTAAPDAQEKQHHYLWRFWRDLPKAGHWAIFDRSWYGRVLVERVEGFCSEAEWKRAYVEINETERQWTANGAVVVKFWLQISADEQLRRFKAREQTPHKQWKITQEDWRNRKQWAVYREAVDDMLFYTGTAHAPWIVISSEDKLHARIRILEEIAGQLEAALASVRKRKR